MIEIIVWRKNIQPLFSIITVVFNDLIGMHQTTNSIQNQSCVDFEWIVVDGSSTDGTKEFIASLGQQVSAWISEKDKGIYDAMNKGIKLAKGRYVVFMNSGDVFTSPATLQKVRDHLEENSYSPDIVFGGTTLMLKNHRQIYRAPRDMSSSIWHGLPAYHQATYYSATQLKNTLYSPVYQICGDYYLAAKLYLQGVKSSYLNDSLVQFTVGGTSYQHPLRLILEPYAIQKSVLKLPLTIRVRSVCKRIVSLAGIAVLSWPCFRKRANHG
jgi:putative colanic acid biosynthesis glycosyltransferase